MAVQHGIPSVISSDKEMYHVQPNIKTHKIHLKNKEHMWKTGVSITLFLTDLWIHIITPDWTLVYLLTPL